MIGIRPVFYARAAILSPGGDGVTVYVDVLFGLNSAINYLLLRGSAAMGGHPVRFGRLLAAACLGGLYAVAVVLPGCGWLQELPIQAICAGLMLLIAFGWKRNTVKQGLFFFGLSFAFGGVVMLLIQLAEPDCMIFGNRAYYAVSTPALLLLAGVGYGISALVLSGWGAHTGGEIQTMQVQMGEQTVPVRVLRDTGNTLRDPISGQTVLVTGKALLETLLSDMVLRAELQDPATLLERLSKDHPKLRFCLVPYRAVGVEAGLLLAIRCSLIHGKRKETILAAFSPTEVSADGTFDAIWGGEIV